MSWKKQLLDRIDLLQKQINSFGENGENTTDATEDFASNDVIAKRAKVDAIIANANVFNYSDYIAATGAKKQSIMNMLRNYQLPVDNNFALEYWYRINSFVDEYFNLLKIWIPDKKLKSKVKECFRWAFLFGRTGIIKDSLEVVNITEIKKDIVLFQPVNYKYDDVEVDTTNEPKEININDIAILDIWWDNIGAYAKSKPLLGKYIAFHRMLESDLSLSRIILDTSYFGRENLAWVNDINNSVIKDKSVDNQDGINSDIGQKQKWFIPPAELEVSFNVLTRYIEKSLNEFKEYWGFPTSEQGEGRQTLSNELENKKDQYVNKLKAIADCVFDFIKDLTNYKEEITPINIESDINTLGNEQNPTNELKTPLNEVSNDVDNEESNKNDEETPETNNEVVLGTEDPLLANLDEEVKGDNFENDSATGDSEAIKELDGTYSSTLEEK